MSQGHNSVDTEFRSKPQLFSRDNHFYNALDTELRNQKFMFRQAPASMRSCDENEAELIHRRGRGDLFQAAPSGGMNSHRRGALRERTFAHFVQRGDTLGEIARQYGTTLARLKRVNPQISDVNKIQAGSIVSIPVTMWQRAAGAEPTQQQRANFGAGVANLKPHLPEVVGKKIECLAVMVLYRYRSGSTT